MVHITSNETIEGVQFATEPDVGQAPLVCDASSDFLSRPVAIDRYGIIYACAQKNVGPAGVTVVVIREDLLARSQESLPGYLNFATHAAENSLWNTPPTFAVYMVGLVAKWLQEDIGGLAKMHELNQQKAAMLYEAIDQQQRILPGPCAAGLPLADECHVPPAQRRVGDGFPGGGHQAGPGPRSRDTAASAAFAPRSTTRCRWQASRSCAISCMDFAHRRGK